MQVRQTPKHLPSPEHCARCVRGCICNGIFILLCWGLSWNTPRRYVRNCFCSAVCPITWSGELPIELGNCTELENLLLHYNDVSGSLPDALGRCSRLKMLSLRNNKLTGWCQPFRADWRATIAHRCTPPSLTAARRAALEVDQ